MRCNIKVQANGCHEWQGALDTSGYGLIKINYKIQKAHRMMWQLYYGQIPVRNYICHKCDNPKCVNIEHLFLGDALANAIDRSKKGRGWEQRRTHCPSGHPYSEENTRVYKQSTRGYLGRHCIQCSKNRRKAFNQKRASSSEW